MSKHWTDKHIIRCNELQLWVTFDEAGLPYSVHTTKEEAILTLEEYGKILEAEDEAVFGDHNIK